MKARNSFLFALLVFCSTTQAQFSLSTIAASCYNNCNGSARITPATGYRYQWNNGDTISFADALCAGTYTCIISDSTGLALDTLSGVIMQPAALAYSLTTDSTTCAHSYNGAIHLVAEGGTPPYYYSANKADSGLVFTLNGNFTGLDSGWYHLVISDVNECALTNTVFVGISSSVCTDINDISQLQSFSILPNPAKDITHITYQLNESMLLRMAIYNLAGKKVQQLTSETESKGSHMHPMNLGTLAAGEYILNVVSDKGSFNLRVVKE